MATPTLIIPTSINFLLMLHDAELTGRKNGVETAVTVPDLRQRAWMIINQTGVIPVGNGT